MSATGGAAAVMIPPVTVDEATTPPRRRRQSASGRTGAAETLLAIHTNSSPSPSPRSVAAGATPAATPSPATAPHFPVETQDTAGNALSTIRRGLSASAGAGAKPGSSGSKHKYPRLEHCEQPDTSHHPLLFHWGGGGGGGAASMLIGPPFSPCLFFFYGGKWALSSYIARVSVPFHCIETCLESCHIRLRAQEVQ